jgi:hypothetical protein
MCDLAHVHVPQALCDASSGLTNFAHEDRQWALMRGLEDISQEIQAATKSGVAIWSPMGTGDDRIVRIAARECKLLNSRRGTSLGDHPCAVNELESLYCLAPCTEEVPEVLIYAQTGEETFCYCTGHGPPAESA